MLVNCLPEFLNISISDTGLTYEWVLSKFEECIPDFLETIGTKTITKVDAKNISNGEGFIAKIFQTKIFVDNEEEPVYKVIMKIPCIEKFSDAIGSNNEEKDVEKEARKLKNLQLIHNNECDFYELFKDIAALALPKVYYTQKLNVDEKQTGVIIMEDLSKKAKTLGVDYELGNEQIHEIVRQLATFHAYQLQNTVKLIGHFERTPFLQDGIADFLIEGPKEFMAKFPGQCDDLIKKFDPILSDKEKLQYLAKDCCVDLKAPMLINFGDLWINNILFEKNNLEKISAFIDFQFAIKGNPACDLAMVLVLSCDPETRHQIEETIFSFYARELSKNMTKFGNEFIYYVSLVVAFRQAYDYCLPIVAITLTSGIPIFLPDGSTETEEEHHQKEEKFVRRTKSALEDALKVLEKYFPEWIQ